MKINLSNQDLVEVQALSDQKSLNMEAADLYNDFLNNHYDSIDERVINDQFIEREQSDSEAFYSAFLKILDLDPNDQELKKLEKNNQFNIVKELDPKSFLENPYIKHIHAPDFPLGKWEYEINRYNPYESFVFDETQVDDKNNYSEKTQLGFFPKEVSYLNLLENNEVWMSITPHEINTMAKPISNAKGKVLMFGLGLGYFSYMVANKPDVKSVTIIEKSESAIKLFEKAILPQFEHKEKIRIIKDDAFGYAKNKMANEQYDYSFFDIYHSPEEGLEDYLKMKKLEILNNKTTYDYWIEESILCLFRRYVLTLIEEQLDGLTDKDYVVVQNNDDKMMQRLFNCLNDYSLNSFADVKDLLSDSSLKKLALKA